MSDKKDRLKEVYDYLRSNYPVHTQIDLAKELKITRQALSSAMNGNVSYLTTNLFQKICGAYPGVFNLDYLLTGEGNLLANKNEPTQVNSHQSESTHINQQQSAPIDADFYRQQLLARDAHIADIMHQLDNMNALVLDYGSKITELNELIADLREQNGSLNAHIEHYKRMVGEEKGRVEEYKNHLDDVRISNVGLQNQIDQQKVRISQLEAELKARRENPLYDYPHPLGVADERDK